MPLPDPVPDVRALDLLRSVAELGSIRRAAYEHHVSQPAASMRLRSLERMLNLQLLDRSSGPARLTAAGLAVVQWSSTVLEAMANLLVGAAAVRSEGQIHLRIAASMTVAEYLAPSWLNRLRASEPNISVSLQMGNSEHVVDVMKRGGADVGFVEGAQTPAGLASCDVQSDDLVVVVSPTHPWANRASVTANELAAMPLVSRESGSGTREVLELAMERLGLLPVPMIELGSTTAIKAAVASGSGPAVLSRLATNGDVEEGRLVRVPTEGLSLDRSIRAVWATDRQLSAPARRFLGLLGCQADRARVGSEPSALELTAEAGERRREPPCASGT